MIHTDEEIKKHILLKVEITNWARGVYGLDEENGDMNPSEAYEMLELGVQHFVDLKVKEREEEIKEKLLTTFPEKATWAYWWTRGRIGLPELYVEAIDDAVNIVNSLSSTSKKGNDV